MLVFQLGALDIENELRCSFCYGCFEKEAPPFMQDKIILHKLCIAPYLKAHNIHSAQAIDETGAEMIQWGKLSPPLSLSLKGQP